MRKLLIPIIEKEYKLTYKSLQIEDLFKSDEVILSNAISGVKKLLYLKKDNIMMKVYITIYLNL